MSELDLAAMVEEATDLPDAVIVGISIMESRAVEPNGVAHKVILLTLLFQVQDGTGLGQQTFVMDGEAANQLRKGLKNPTRYTPPTDNDNDNPTESQEDTPQ